MTVAHRLDIRRLAVTCLHAADHPSPDMVQRRLHDLLGGIGDELGEAVAPFAAGQGVWLLRRVEVDLSLDLDAPADACRRLWARSLAHGIAGQLDRSADGVVFFADRTAHLARFLLDLATGDAWSLWYHRGFSGLRSLPLPMALRTAVLAEPERGLAALASLPMGDLARVLDALGAIEAGRILDELRAAPMAEALPILLGHLEADGWPPLSPGCPNRLALALTIHLPAAGIAACARVVARLRHLRMVGGDPLAGSDPVSLCRELSTREAGMLLPVLAVAPALRARLAKAVAPSTPVSALTACRHTPFGGPFMLLRLLDELPEDGLASWPEIDGAPAAVAVRALVLAAAVGPADSLALLLDPVWRELLRLPPSMLPASLGHWCAGIDPALPRRWRRRLAGVPRGRGRALPPALCRDPMLDRAIGAACRWLLGRLAHRLPGFAGSSPAYLRANILGVHARLEVDEGRWRVTLSRPPLDVVLAMTGLARGRIDLPWLAAPLELCREG